MAEPVELPQRPRPPAGCERLGLRARVDWSLDQLRTADQTIAPQMVTPTITRSNVRITPSPERLDLLARPQLRRGLGGGRELTWVQQDRAV